MDRLARSLGDLREIVDEITGKGVSVAFVKEQQTYSRDTDDAIGRLMLNLCRGCCLGDVDHPPRRRRWRR
jgi:DNA invertase Pin-like site-specific DNA recombinase